MKRLLIVPALILASGLPAKADDTQLQEGMDLLGQGMQLLFEGLLDETRPALEGVADALGDLRAYHPPEVLPNGDILIRRKTPLEDAPPEEGAVAL